MTDNTELTAYIAMPLKTIVEIVLTTTYKNPGNRFLAPLSRHRGKGLKKRKANELRAITDLLSSREYTGSCNLLCTGSYAGPMASV